MTNQVAADLLRLTLHSLLIINNGRSFISHTPSCFDCHLLVEEIILSKAHTARMYNWNFQLPAQFRHPFFGLKSFRLTPEFRRKKQESAGFQFLPVLGGVEFPIPATGMCNLGPYSTGPRIMRHWHCVWWTEKYRRWCTEQVGWLWDRGCCGKPLPR